MNQNNNAQFQPPVNSQAAPQQPIMQQQMKPQMPIMQIRKTKSKFLTFCCALVPGMGQMYQGMLKRGLSIMGLFWGIIAVSVTLYIPVINFALPVLWFYSFFDAANRMNTTIDELRLIKDDYIFNVDLPKSNAFTSMLKKRHLWVGWLLVLVGLYSVLRLLLDRMYSFFGSALYDSIYQVFRIVPSLLVPVVCILIGVKLIKNSYLKNEADKITQN